MPARWQPGFFAFVRHWSCFTTWCSLDFLVLIDPESHQHGPPAHRSTLPTSAAPWIRPSPSRHRGLAGTSPKPPLHCGLLFSMRPVEWSGAHRCQPSAQPLDDIFKTGWLSWCNRVMFLQVWRDRSSCSDEKGQENGMWQHKMTVCTLRPSSKLNWSFQTCFYLLNFLKVIVMKATIITMIVESDSSWA